MTAGKEKKRVDRSNASLKASAAAEKQLPTDAELDTALQIVRSEDLPTTPEEKEQYFMQNLALGEQLAAQGKQLTHPSRD
jgi:mitochondrial import receptor subunit TOM20